MLESIQRAAVFAGAGGVLALLGVTCGGTVVVDPGGAGGEGVGGSQQSSTSVSVSNVGPGPGPGPGPGVGTGPGPGPGPGAGGSSGDCRGCADYLVDASDQMTLEPTGAPLCQPASQNIWEVLLTCSCKVCVSECPPSACPGGSGMADTCGDCLNGTFTSACSTEFGDCANDV